jgi:hypothetical protein
MFTACSACSPQNVANMFRNYTPTLTTRYSSKSRFPKGWLSFSWKGVRPQSRDLEVQLRIIKLQSNDVKTASLFDRLFITRNQSHFPMVLDPINPLNEKHQCGATMAGQTARDHKCICIRSRGHPGLHECSSHHSFLT